MIKCTYRANTTCRMPERSSYDKNCELCLMGQLCDETSLNTRAFMDASISRLEKEAKMIEEALRE